MPLLFFTRRKARLFFCALGRKAGGSAGLCPGDLLVLRPYRSCGGLRGFAPVPCGFGVCKTFVFCILFW